MGSTLLQIYGKQYGNKTDNVIQPRANNRAKNSMLKGQLENPIGIAPFRHMRNSNAEEDTISTLNWRVKDSQGVNMPLRWTSETTEEQIRLFEHNRLARLVAMPALRRAKCSECGQRERLWKIASDGHSLGLCGQLVSATLMYEVCGTGNPQLVLVVYR